MRARRAYRLSLVILGVASVVNVIVAIRVLAALRSPVSYNFRVIEPPIITNVVTSGAFDARLPGQPVEEPPQHLDVSPNLVVSASTNRVEVAIDAYHFMRVDGAPFIRLNGVTYKSGDICAYGRISSIFPERVYFDDGSYLTNSRRIFDLVDVSNLQFQPSPKNKESDNERKPSSDT